MTARPPTVLTLDLAMGWEPPKTPHCSDCFNAKVHGHPEQPRVYCAMGEGRGQPIDLWRLIRRAQPRGFRAAATCPFFESMSDEETP